MTDLEEKQPGNKPRQKLLQYGAKALTNVELLAVLLDNGQTALDLAQKTLDEFDNFPRLWEAGLDQFCAAANGLGETHYARLQTCAEIARRCSREQLQCHQVLWSKAMLEYQHFLMSVLNRQDEEVFACLFVDHNRQIQAFESVLVENDDGPAALLDDSFLDETLGPILQHQAANLVFAHYYPNFDAQVKRIDHSINQWLIQTLILLDRQLLDYLVIGDSNYFSLTD